MQRLLPIVLLMFLGGCQAADDSSGTTPTDLKMCKEPRLQMCPMHYDPVCAWMPETASWKTASNGCSACSDKRVSGYLKGACK
jgi:hypothetical protein